jgi:hypothetical protein
MANEPTQTPIAPDPDKARLAETAAMLIKNLGVDHLQADAQQVLSSLGNNTLHSFVKNLQNEISRPGPLKNDRPADQVLRAFSSAVQSNPAEKEINANVTNQFVYPGHLPSLAAPPHAPPPPRGRRHSLDKATLTRFSADIAHGTASHDEVTAVQKALIESGVNIKYGADGIAGKYTKTAMQKAGLLGSAPRSGKPSGPTLG